jgi:hypothetical protein
MKFSDLTALALLGTERQELPQEVAGTPAASLQAQLDMANRERALLSAAAIAGIHDCAGRLPPTDSGPMPEACPAESLPYSGARASGLLLRMLFGDFPAFLPEWLNRAGHLEQLAPPEAVPALLALATRSAELRVPALKVIGNRGQWLASQNAEWSWVAGSQDDDSVWQNGAADARALFLARLRQTDPNRARELLMATWREEAPDDRATLISLFQFGLNTEDEPFLESALDDKRKEARRAAAGLLGRLPESRLAKRMLERARPLVRFIPGEAGSVLRLKKGKPATLEITLPQACDKSMQRDGVDLKPQQGMGEKTAWLIQLLEVAPLDHWLREFNVSPEEIIAASQNSEWKSELLEAWTRAAIRQGRADWAEAVLDLSVSLQPVRIQSLLALLPLPRREARVMELLSNDQQKELHAMSVALSAHDWSVDFSRTVLEWLRQVTAQPSMDWQLRSELKNFATRIHPDALEAVPRHWPEDSAGWDFWSKGVDELLSAAQFRHDVLTALQQNQ